MGQTQKAVADFTSVTSNEHKVVTARAICGQFGLAFDWRKMDLEEIQAENGEPIAEHKMRQAIIMKHIIAYKDERAEKVFSAEIKGVLLPEARGESVIPHFSVISFDGGRHSAAEVENENYTVLSELPNAWHQLGEWLRR